ncbi:orotidine-5'-phosphate decarboxylase [Corynebacterium timonense]|uniref:Orotidine 5'-phosphate decarboxylase n=1 Tax=Corynebacterium timonense TaxID=441500 RepID=A0A1H1NRX8_9CORY|nr:orotidine-5'-phosphate decarboxylase [Corynebacterium timonense]SDS01736.1 orotidine-5'-phosphate decarboxylase [Corynebacterium timonense]
MGFGERLVEAGQRHGRLCVGIDPHAALLQQWGLGDDVAGLRTFTRTCVEAFAGHVALVKPQVAFFERFGSAGFVVLEEALAALREAGTLVVADAKRGDIGSTMAGYAQAWLGVGSPLEADAVTLTPFLGVGSLTPAIELARENGKGVFVMAANSNPEAVAFQSQQIDDVSIAQQMVNACAQYNRGPGVGDVGVVVGATVAQPPVLDTLNAPVLMPGVGAQGASFADADRVAGTHRHAVFPNVSRGVLSAGPHVRDLRQRAAEMAQPA